MLSSKDWLDEIKKKDVEFLDETVQIYCSADETPRRFNLDGDSEKMLEFLLGQNGVVQEPAFQQLLRDVAARQKDSGKELSIAAKDGSDFEYWSTTPSEEEEDCDSSSSLSDSKSGCGLSSSTESDSLARDLLDGFDGGMRLDMILATNQMALCMVQTKLRPHLRQIRDLALLMTQADKMTARWKRTAAGLEAFLLQRRPDQIKRLRQQQQQQQSASSSLKAVDGLHRGATVEVLNEKIWRQGVALGRPRYDLIKVKFMYNTRTIVRWVDVKKVRVCNYSRQRVIYNHRSTLSSFMTATTTTSSFSSSYANGISNTYVERSSSSNRRFSPRSNDLLGENGIAHRREKALHKYCASSLLVSEQKEEPIVSPLDHSTTIVGGSLNNGVWSTSEHIASDHSLQLDTSFDHFPFSLYGLPSLSESESCQLGRLNCLLFLETVISFSLTCRVLLYENRSSTKSPSCTQCVFAHYHT